MKVFQSAKCYDVIQYDATDKMMSSYLYHKNGSSTAAARGDIVKKYQTQELIQLIF